MCGNRPAFSPNRAHDGISLIEWPERLGGLLPARRLNIALDFGPKPGSRRATLTRSSEWSTRLAGMGMEA